MKWGRARMKGLLFVLYALLFAIFIIAYKKNSFVFWGLLFIILIFVYVIVKIVRSSVKGSYFLNKGDAKKAVDIYSALIASPFKSIKAMGFANRGIVYLKTKKYNFALYDFIESAKIDILPLLNIAQIGIIYCEFKEYDRALKYFLRVIELKPKSSIAYGNLGWFYSQTKEYDKAIESLNKSMTLREIRDNSVIIGNTYSNLGFIYTKLKEYDKAEEFFSKAVNLNFKKSGNLVKAGIYRNYAYLQRVLGNSSLTKEYALKSIALNPYEHVSYKTLAEISLIEGDYDGFYTNFETFLDKKGRIIDTDDVEDKIYEKVKDEERFDLLIKRTTSNLKTNNINISVNDSEILSCSVNKGKKTNLIKRTIISILLLIVVIVSLSISNKQFHKSTIVKKASISDIDKGKADNNMIGIYKTFDIDKNKVIINSPKFKVAWNTTNVKIGETIKFNVIGLKPTAKIPDFEYNAAIYANAQYSVSGNESIIPNWETTNNKIKSYVFIKPTDEDMTYQYDFILTEIK